MIAADWVARLRAYVAERNLARPALDDNALNALERWQYRIHGGFMQTWLRKHGPQMLNERAAFAELQRRVSPNPVVVAHGDVPFAVAMRVLVGDAGLRGEGRVVVLLDDEYERFMAANPEAGADDDREFDFHVSTWSRFAPAPPALLAYLNHVNGTLWAPRCGLQVENLWSWNGTEMHLIEEGIAHVRY